MIRKNYQKKNLEILNNQIHEKSKAVAIYEIQVKTIDKMGIKKAILYGMQKVVKKLEVTPDFALIDFEKPRLSCESFSMKKGDANSNSIAAASIVAKYYRDQKIKKIDKKYLGYDFDTNVGYETKKHLEGMEIYCVVKGLHRESFAPVKK